MLFLGMLSIQRMVDEHYYMIASLMCERPGARS